MIALLSMMTVDDGRKRKGGMIEKEAGE